MEFVTLEREDADEKGAIAVNVTAPASAVRQILGDFYETVARSKGLPADAAWDDVDAAVLRTMAPESYRELKRDFAVNLIVSEALRELGITPALTPKIHVLEYPSPDEDYAVSLSVVEQPHITLSSYEPVTVHADLLEVTDVAVASRVAEVLDRYAVYEDAEARPVAMGDTVLLDMDTQQGDKIVPHLSGKHRTLTLEADAMPKPFLDGIVGMEPGETRTVEFAVPRPRAISKDDVDRYLSTVTVLGQQRKVEVELTDDWVRAHYPSVADVAGFFEETRKDVAFDIDALNRDTVAHLANVELEKRLVGDIPDAFYQASYQNLMAKFEADLERQGKTVDDYYEQEQTNEQELSVKLLIQSGEGLKQGFALEALFDGRGMSVDDADVEDAGRRFFGEGAGSLDDLRRSGRYKLALSMAKRARAMAWLVQTATVLPEEA